MRKLLIAASAAALLYMGIAPAQAQAPACSDRGICQVDPARARAVTKAPRTDMRVLTPKAPKAKRVSGRPLAVVKSGLLDDFGLFTQPVVQKLQKAGYQVERRPWWFPESDARPVALAVGHSMGGSAVLTCPRGTCVRVVSIDPPRMNPGCRSGNCDNYHSPYNPIGGGSARGARNHRIPAGHLRAPIYVLPHLP
jgi:hypothetical protein